MNTSETQELKAVLVQSFGLELPDGLVPEAKLLAALAWRVSQLINGNPDQLFSMLYRLDISERKIKEAMAQEGDVSKKIAVLIYERQLEKIISRQRFRSDHPEDDLAW